MLHRPLPLAPPRAERPADSTLRALLETARRGERTLVMGILNVTPDSFSDGGRYFDREAAIAHAEQMVAEGADLLDIGGESTRPATFDTHATLPPDEERRRILPVIEAVSAHLPAVPLSVDTYKAEVARDAVLAGAAMVNDISAFRADPQMAATVAELGVPVCLMHLLGQPKAIPREPHYQDVVAEVCAHLTERATIAQAAGLSPEQIILDPGIGFGKTVAHNLALLRHLNQLVALGYPVLIGTSRKSFIGKTLGDLPPDDRLEGTAATITFSMMQGATLVRVHDVREMVRVVRMTDALLGR